MGKTERKLKREFQVKVSGAQIYKLLMETKKRKEETREKTLKKYFLKMREIGSRANVEPEAIIEYIIDGIVHDPSNKIVLYGAKHFEDFKEKITI